MRAHIHTNTHTHAHTCSWVDTHTHTNSRTTIFPNFPPSVWVGGLPKKPCVSISVSLSPSLSLSVSLLSIMDPHSRAPKKNTSHGNEVLPQDTTHLIQRPCYQWGSPCQDPAGNWTIWRSPDDCKKMQTAVVWLCFLFIRSGQNHLARHSERGKKTRRTKEEVGRQHQGMDRPGVQQVPEGSGEQGQMEKTGCKIICGAPTTLAVKGLMMMMMTQCSTIILHSCWRDWLQKVLQTSVLHFFMCDTPCCFFGAK